MSEPTPSMSHLERTLFTPLYKGSCNNGRGATCVPPTATDSNFGRAQQVRPIVRKQDSITPTITIGDSMGEEYQKPFV